MAPSEWASEEDELALALGSGDTEPPNAEGSHVERPCCRYACVACFEEDPVLRATCQAWHTQMSRYAQAEKLSYIYDLLKRMRSAKEGLAVN